MPIRHWAELTTDEFRDRDMRRAIAVLPVAAIEQHGPHLPLATDAIIAEGYLAAPRRRLPADDLDVLLLPVQAVGKSDEHDEFPRDPVADHRDGPGGLDRDRRCRPPRRLRQARHRHRRMAATAA